MKEGIHIANKEETKKRKNSLIVIMLCLIMVIAGTIAGIFLAPLFHKDSYDKNAVDIVRQLDDSQTQKFADNIAIPCWDSLTMKANKYTQSVNFYNPATNKGINFKLTYLWMMA